jgi:hypothetical protein
MHKDRGLMQGDLIGRTSALWAIIYISHLKNCLSEKNIFVQFLPKTKL